MLKEIRIDDLQTGMFVHGIADQQGDLKVKTRGRITSEKVIHQLRKRGIVKLVVDADRTEDAANPDQMTSDQAEAAVTDTTVQPKEVPFEVEIPTAIQLNIQGRKLQRVISNLVANGAQVDVSLATAFITKMVASINRNPNALLCLTKIREKDIYLYEHSLNVSVLMAIFGKFMGASEKEMKALAFSGFLHDIGKVKVPANILNKTGKLTEAEQAIMEDHVDLGMNVLGDIKGIPANIIRTMSEHHERLDGSGYPRGKKSEEISPHGRMLGIVDSYDAISTNRCYKNGCPSDRALKILMKDSPEKFDKKLVTAFVSTMGVYPVGNLVLLSNGNLAMVMAQNPGKLAYPVVKMFYSAEHRHFLKPKDLDLSAPIRVDRQVRVEKAVMASDYDIDFNKYFHDYIVVE